MSKDKANTSAIRMSPKNRLMLNQIKKAMDLPNVNEVFNVILIDSVEKKIEKLCKNIETNKMLNLRKYLAFSSPRKCLSSSRKNKIIFLNPDTRKSSCFKIILSCFKKMIFGCVLLGWRKL